VLKLRERSRWCQWHHAAICWKFSCAITVPRGDDLQFSISRLQSLTSSYNHLRSRPIMMQSDTNDRIVVIRRKYRVLDIVKVGNAKRAESQRRLWRNKFRRLDIANSKSDVDSRLSFSSSPAGASGKPPIPHVYHQCN